MLYEELRQRESSAKSSASAKHGVVYAGPGFTAGFGNQAAVADRPAPGVSVKAIGPREDLTVLQSRSFMQMTDTAATGEQVRDRRLAREAAESAVERTVDSVPVFFGCGEYAPRRP